MFLYLLVLLLVGAGIHVAVLSNRTRQRAAEVVLLWVLVGYCGIPMLLVALGSLGWPSVAAAHLGFPAGNPFQAFMSVAYLGMALMAILSLRYRDTFLLAPVVGWTVFFAGATVIHLHDYGARGVLSHGAALWIFGTHGLVAVILAVAMAMRGVREQR